MKRIENERLFELKRLKQLEWLDKRKEKEKEVASKVAKEHELKRNSKNIRLEKAALCTLTARTSTWRISDSGAASPKRKREGDWHTTSTPLKKLRGWGGGGPKPILNLPECTVAKYPPPPSRNQVQENIEEKHSKGGAEKTPPPRKMPQVKTKKWMKGKNGLFRWVSSLKPGISSKPNQTEGVNKQNKKQIFGNCGGDGPAAVTNTDQIGK